MKVVVRNNNVDKVLAIFKRKTNDVVYETRNREEYIKPSDKYRRARKVAKMREKRRQAADWRPA